MKATRRTAGPAVSLIAGLGLLLLVAPARAATGVPVDGTLAEPRVALRVNDWTLSTASLQALLRAVRAQNPDVTPAQVAAAVAEDRVLGTHARRYDEATLFAGERVRFSPRAAIEASLVTTLQAAFAEPLAKAAAGEGYIVRRHPLTRQRLVALLDTGGKLRLDDRLPPAREAKLRDVPLIDGRVGAQSFRVTLHDVWDGLDVQGRNALYRFDVEYALQQARQLARDRFVLGWARQKGGLGAEDLAQLRQLVADRNRRNALARLLGSNADDTHYSSPEVERLQRGVEPAAIRRYYDANKSEFTRTQRVLARTMRFADESRARAASAELAKGARFEAVARRRGAGDGKAAWIDSTDASGSWVAQLAFAQAAGPASPPVREPEGGAQAPGWIIVQVDKRVTGLHPPDSETVRFAASQAIARQRAASGYAKLRAHLLAQARFTINPGALGVRTAPKVLEAGP